MSTAVETLKTVLAELTVEERSELARFLVDSIDLWRGAPTWKTGGTVS